MIAVYVLLFLPSQALILSIAMDVFSLIATILAVVFWRTSVNKRNKLFLHMIRQPYGKISPEGAGNCVIERVDGSSFLLLFICEYVNDDDSLFRGDDPVLPDAGVPVFDQFLRAVQTGRRR